MLMLLLGLALGCALGFAVSLVWMGPRRREGLWSHLRPHEMADIAERTERANAWRAHYRLRQTRGKEKE
jgi:hypothetical protein